MKTEVIMKRELFGESISQKSKSEFFSATDLVKAGNKWRIINNIQPFDLTQFFQTKGYKEFEKELIKKYEIVKISARGRGQHTWVHPLIFIDIALAINPRLKIEVYEWLFDNLIKYRNSSGDSYKKMCGALFEKTRNKANFYKDIEITAEKIKLACKVKNWENATQEQLEKRDKIHNDIALLCDVLNSGNQAVRIILEKNS